MPPKTRASDNKNKTQTAPEQKTATPASKIKPILKTTPKLKTAKIKTVTPASALHTIPQTTPALKPTAQKRNHISSSESFNSNLLEAKSKYFLN
jgi:hypothetical protein